MKNQLKNGISLITLVITIIVVIILAGVVILSLQKNNPIENATKAKFLSDISTFKEQVELYKQNEILKNNGEFDENSIQADSISLTQSVADSKYSTIYDIITELKNSSYGKDEFVVIDGQLVYQGKDKKYQDWAKDAGVDVEKGQVKINIVANSSLPVKAGIDVKYSISITSVSNITSTDKLKDNILILDKDKNVLATQPSITLSDVNGTDISKTLTLTISTTGMSDGMYYVKISKNAINNDVNVANDETISKEDFEIDNTAPEAPKITSNPTAWTNQSVVVSISYPSDAVKKEYSYDGTNWSEYSKALTINSNTIVYARAIDVVGNISSQSTLSISNIDTVAPKDTTIEAGVNGKVITIRFTMNDGESGIDLASSKYMVTKSLMKYEANNNIWNNQTSLSENPETVTVDETTNRDGDYYIQILSVDKAGNATVTISTAVTIISKTENAPILASGMTPIKWTNGTGDPVNTTASDSTWYDYTNKQWANSMTKDGSMWVWIPRYEYKITSLNHQSSTMGGNIDVKFIKTSQTIADDGYIIEPAFTFGTTQLSGIWVAKFEATAREGVANTTDGDNVTTKHVKVIPDVQSWRYSYILTMFNVCRNMKSDSTYGWSSSEVDIHLMKNIEWGACAYLAQSSYGKNSEVTINSNASFYTGDGSYISHQGESTTGNVYGIYDMSGGAWEYVAAYVNNGNSNLTTYGNSLVNADIKYKDVYTSNGDTRIENYSAASSKVGDAVYETSSSGDAGSYSWYSDYSYMPYSNNPFFKRGGSCNSGTNAGLFGFSNVYGGDVFDVGFRPVLVVDDGI